MGRLKTKSARGNRGPWESCFPPIPLAVCKLPVMIFQVHPRAGDVFARRAGAAGGMRVPGGGLYGLFEAAQRGW